MDHRLRFRDGFTSSHALDLRHPVIRNGVRNASRPWRISVFDFPYNFPYGGFERVRRISKLL